MARLCVAKESVWFDQGKYEGAETRYQEVVAQRHTGLRIEVGICSITDPVDI